MRKLLTMTLSVLALGACQHGQSQVPALLSDGDADTISKLEAALADAMGISKVTLGAGDPTTNSTVSVLPPKLNPSESRSTAMPTRFELLLKDGTCYAQREGSEDMISLAGISCKPA